MKRWLLPILCASFILSIGIQSASAQESTCEATKEKKYCAMTRLFWDNWFISAGVGAQTLIGTNDSKADFGDRIAPAIQISAGKWFTPGLGLRLSYSGLQAKGATVAGNPFAGSKMANGYYKQKFDMMYLHGDIMFNLTNMFCGYKEDRLYSAIPFIGAGWARTFGDAHNDEIAVTIGLINQFRLSNAWNLNLEVSGLLLRDLFDGEQGTGVKVFDKDIHANGMATVLVGATYKFKKRDFIKASDVVTLDEMNRIRQGLNDQIAAEQANANNLQNANNALKQENKDLRDENAALKGKVNNAQCQADTESMSRYVFFKINSSKLSSKEKKALSYSADAIKANPDKKYFIAGYADSETGSAAYNQELSQKRAETVKDILVKEYDINADQLVAVGKGGVNNLFANTTMNRATVIRPLD